MKDFFQQELFVGDRVAFISTDIKVLDSGTIVSIGPTMVKVEYTARFSQPQTQKYKGGRMVVIRPAIKQGEIVTKNVYPKDIVKAPNHLSTGVDVL